MRELEKPDVLIVDDHLDTREALTEVLQAEGYSVLTLESARDALVILKKGARPSLLLVDLEVPNFSGWGLCSSIASEPDLRDIPIAIITAVSAYRGVPPRTVDAGVFRKPLDFDALLETVRHHVPRSILA
jgi:CheY-like chemotaxis protein